MPPRAGEPKTIRLEDLISVPPELATVTIDHRATYWRLVGDRALRVKKGEILDGIGADGERLLPVQRRGGGPPLVPHRANSRTYRLLALAARADGASLYWRSGGGRTTWPTILGYHAYKHGPRSLPIRNTIGISPEGTREVMAESEAWRAGFKAGRDAAMKEIIKGGKVSPKDLAPRVRAVKAKEVPGPRETKLESEIRERAEAEAKRKAEEEARRKAEEERRRALEEERRREEEARRRIEEEARKRAEAEARKRARAETRARPPGSELTYTGRRAAERLEVARALRESSRAILETATDEPTRARALQRIRRAEVIEEYVKEPRLPWEPARSVSEAIAWGKPYGVSVVPGHESRVTLEQLNAINEDLAKMPARAMETLVAAGRRFDVVAGTSITGHPDFAHLKGKQPRGYAVAGSDRTWDDVPGASGPTVTVVAAGSLRAKHGSVSIVLHEQAHDYDKAHAQVAGEVRPSRSREWLDIHAQVVRNDAYLSIPEEGYAEDFAKYFADPIQRAALPEAVRDYFARKFPS